MLDWELGRFDANERVRTAAKRAQFKELGAITKRGGTHAVFDDELQ